jgi:hypothetical protein
MSKAPIQTYTISADPLYSSSSSNIHHLEIPNNGNDIKIIITEPTPPKHKTPARIHFVEPNPTNNRKITRFETSNTMPTIEIVEVSPSDKTNTSRGLQTDFNNTSDASWIITGESLSTNSDRYGHNNRRKSISYDENIK